MECNCDVCTGNVDFDEAVDYCGELCEDCHESIDDCECERCSYCDKVLDYCWCEYCDYCDEHIEECECEICESCWKRLDDDCECEAELAEE